MDNLYTTVAAMSFTWLCVCYPLINRIKIVTPLVFFFWLIFIPTYMLFNDSLNVTLANDNKLFTTIKFLSIVIATLVMQILIVKKYDKHVNLIIGSLFFVNILEAVVTQFRDRDDTVDTLNSVIGIFLLIWLVFNSNIKLKGGLQSNFNIWYILAYTAWNLLFRSELLQNDAVLLFFGVSLVLPIVSHVTNKGDWLQVRAYTLLTTLILTWGLGSGKWRILPQYNQDGYVEEDDKLKKILNHNGYRYTVLGLGIIFTILSFGGDSRRLLR